MAILSSIMKYINIL